MTPVSVLALLACPLVVIPHPECSRMGEESAFSFAVPSTVTTELYTYTEAGYLSCQDEAQV
jgi:hypothetical protein